MPCCSIQVRAARNAEKIQGFERAGNPGVAIASEEEDGRIYGEFANALRESYPATAQMFEGMREEEAGHRDRLIEMFRQRFGEHIPLIRRENVKGFCGENPDVAGAAAGRQRGAKTGGGGWSWKRNASTRKPSRAARTRRRANC